MMKKLLVLMLVLGMASLANAGLVDVLDLDLTDSTTLVVRATNDWAAGETYDYGVMLIGVTLTGASNVDTSALAVTLVQDSNNGQAGPPWAAFRDPLGFIGIAAATANLDPENAFTVSSPFAIFEIDFTGIGTAQIIGLGANLGTNGPVSGYIPEPMTMVLLGLGGLFLRRRK